MAKFKIKDIFHQLKERFTHHKQELQRTDEEYEKERKHAHDIKVHKNFGPRSKTSANNRDISAI